MIDIDDIDDIDTICILREETISQFNTSARFFIAIWVIYICIIILYFIM